MALWGLARHLAWTPTWFSRGTNTAAVGVARQIYKGLNLDVQSFVYGPMPTQPLGWFKKPVTKVEDFKGLNTVRLVSIDIFTALGAAVNALPGGEIVAAMDRGLLTPPSSTTPAQTRFLASRMFRRYACCPSTKAASSSRSFNRTKYNALPADLKAVCWQCRAGRLSRHELEGDRPLLAGLHRAAKNGVKFTRRLTLSCRRNSKAWDDITKKKSAEKSTQFKSP